MIIPKIIFVATIIAWLLPPFRQKGHRYFLYFLILALSDPIWFLINNFYPGNSSFYYLVISTLTLISVMRKKYLFASFIPIILIGIFLDYPEVRIFTFIVHFILLLYFLKEFIIIISKDSKIVFFNLILLLYEATVLFKFGASYFTTAGYLFFYITTAFEIFIAAFFTLYNEENSPVLKLRMVPEQGEGL